MTAAEALARYRAEAGPKFAARVEAFLRWGGTNTDASLTAYVRELSAQGLRPGTVDLHVRTIRAFYRRFGLPAPRPRGFRFDPRDSHRPALDRALIESLLRAAKEGELPAGSAWMLVLAATYGMRAGELAAVRPEDVDLDGQRLYIRTLKGGQPRWCWLPPEVAALLPGELPRVSANQAESAFAGIWGAVLEVERPKGTGWHSIRRSLVRDLRLAGVPREARTRFLRWKGGGGDGAERMDEWYGHPSEVVGVSGVEAAREEDAGRREYDAAVWDRHPYLPILR